MNKICLTYLFTSIVLTFLGGQNNYVYDGGQGQGFHYSTTATESQNSIFSGSSNDGFSFKTKQENLFQWNGGREDGMDFDSYHSNTNNHVYFGGLEDGMDYKIASIKNSNSIFNGDDDDGFSYSVFNSTVTSLVIDGGVGDGFSYSGISNLIWDGDLNKEWTMADNWNIPMVPTLNISATIPDMVPNYPLLKGYMGIGIPAIDYVCSDLYVLENAIINGSKHVNILVYNTLHVWGTMSLNTSPYARMQTFPNGIIHVYPNGNILLK